MAQFKLIAEIGAFKVYKAPNVVVIHENDEFFVQLFRRSNAADYRNPEAYVRAVIAQREEIEADKAFQRAGFRALLAKARAERAAQIARQGVLAL